MLCVEYSSLRAVFDTRFGQPSSTLDYIWVRDSPRGGWSGFHCDSICKCLAYAAVDNISKLSARYVRLASTTPFAHLRPLSVRFADMMKGTDELTTCWIPLQDTPLKMAPLCVVEGSNSLPWYAQSFDSDAKWMSANSEQGDVLCVGIHTLHGSLVNQTDVSTVDLDASSHGSSPVELLLTVPGVTFC